MRKKQTQCSR